MPISYNSGTKTVTAEWQAGDGKGNSLANAWTIDDLQAAVAAGGDGALWTVQGNQHDITDIKIVIQGSGTWVHFYGAAINWTTSEGIIVLEVVTPANLHVGRGVVEQNNNINGCLFTFNAAGGSLKLDGYGGEIKIYDSLFQSTNKQNNKYYSIRVRGNFLNPLIIKGCILFGANYILDTRIAGWYDLSNIIFDDNYIAFTESGIKYETDTDFKSIKNLKAYGRIADIYNCSGIWRGEKWNCPNGEILLRLLGAGTRVFRAVNSNITYKFNVANPTLNAIAEYQEISTFIFKIQNGANADVKIYDRNNALHYSGSLDGSGELTEEIMYFNDGRECTQVTPTVVINTFGDTYHPFRIEIEKTGYQKEVIPDIYCIKLQETVIRAALKLTQLSINEIDITDTTEGKSNGRVEVTATGGDTNYTYSLGGVTYQNDNYFENLSKGSYTVYVKDGQGWIDSIDFEIKEKVGVIITAVDITHLSKIGAKDGKLEITAEGGTDPYTYSINGTDYQVSNEFDNLEAGNYTVYVKDSLGDIATFDVEVTEPVPEQYVYVDKALRGIITPNPEIKGIITKVIIKSVIEKN